MSAGWTIILISPNRKTASDVLPLVAQQLPTSVVTELSGYPSSGVLSELRQSGGAIDPIGVFRQLDIRRGLIEKRGHSVAVGL